MWNLSYICIKYLIPGRYVCQIYADCFLFAVFFEKCIIMRGGSTGSARHLCTCMAFPFSYRAACTSTRQRVRYIYVGMDDPTLMGRKRVARRLSWLAFEGSRMASAIHAAFSCARANVLYETDDNNNGKPFWITHDQTVVYINLHTRARSGQHSDPCALSALESFFGDFSAARSRLVAMLAPSDSP